MRRTGRSDGGRDDRTPGAWTEERRVRSLTLFKGRASTSVLGFTLMFSITMTTFALYQADVVPHQNEQVEYQHNQGMDAELRKLGGRMHQATVEGAEASVTLDTAPEYPSRAVARNPPPPDGTIRTITTGTVALTGFHSRTTLQPYWDGSERRFDTRMLAYEPRYNKIEGASYWVEQGVVAKRYANGQSRVVRGQVVSGRTISLTLLSGDIERTGDSSTVRFRPVSTTTERLTVTPGSAPTVTLPTRLSESHWKDRAEESTTIESVDHRGDEVELALADDIDPSDGDTEPYSLRLTKVTVDGPAEVSDPSTDAEYLTVSGSSVTREADGTVSLSGTTGTTTTVTFRTRDRFGNPSPATVDLTGVSGPDDDELAEILPDSLETGADGVARLRLTPAEPVDAAFTATLPGNPGDRGDIQVDLDATANNPSGIDRMEINDDRLLFEGIGETRSLRLSELYSEEREVDDSVIPETDIILFDTLDELEDVLRGRDTHDTTRFVSDVRADCEPDGTDCERYSLAFELVDADRDGTVTKSDANDEYEEDDYAVVQIDSESGDPVFSGVLKPETIGPVYAEKSGSLDLLEAGSYKQIEWDDDRERYEVCVDDCGFPPANDETETRYNYESTSSYDDGDSDGGHTEFDQFLTDISRVYVRQSAGHATVEADPDED